MEQRPLARLTPEQSEALTASMRRTAYLQCASLQCPDCGCRDVVSNTPLIASFGITPRKLTQTFTCRECGFCWEDVFKLVDMTTLTKVVLK